MLVTGVGVCMEVSSKLVNQNGLAILFCGEETDASTNTSIVDVLFFLQRRFLGGITMV